MHSFGHSRLDRLSPRVKVFPPFPPRICLVFPRIKPIVATMDKPWYRNLFSSGQKLNLKSTRARADAGNADAQFCLGLQYAAGEGGAQDNLQAAGWYLKAADQSHAMAQFNLAMMYAQGQGVDRDEAKALVWLERAAKQGDAGAQFNLGMREHRASGTGTALAPDALESRIEAYKWF